MAHGADDLVGGVELIDQRVRCLVRGEVEHGAVAADVEDGLVLVGVAEERRQLARVLPRALARLQELGRHGVRFEGFYRRGVERGGAAGRGGDYDLAVRREDFVGVRHLGLGIEAVSGGAVLFCDGAE